MLNAKNNNTVVSINRSKTTGRFVTTAYARRYPQRVRTQRIVRTNTSV